MTPIFFGGLLRHWLERGTADAKEAGERRERGILLGSGFVGGEGLLGVGIAGAAITLGGRPEGVGTGWLGGEATAMAAGLLAFLAFAAWFVWNIRRGSTRS
jgi:hypothetical protein